MARDRLYKYGRHRFYCPLPQDFVLAFKTPGRLRSKILNAIRERWPDLPWDAQSVTFEGTAFAPKKTAEAQESTPTAAESPVSDDQPSTVESVPPAAPPF